MILAGSGYVNKDNPITLQELMISCKQELGVAVKNSWFQGRNDGVNEVNGAFIYSFKNVAISKDEDTGLFYSELPSSYIDLPHEMGFNLISFMKSQDKPFVRLASGQIGLFSGLKSAGMANHKQYWVENDKVFYNDIETIEAESKVLIKLAVALDAFDDDYNLNIPPDIASVVIAAVVQRYGVEKQIPKDDTNNSNSTK